MPDATCSIGTVNLGSRPKATVPGAAQPDGLRPERRPVVARVDVADLAHGDPDAVVMELLAQAEADGVVLVEADRDDEPASPDDPGRFMERERRAGALEGDDHAVGAVPTLEGRRDVDRAVGLDRLESQ